MGPTMGLPEALERAIENAAAGIPAPVLAKSAAELGRGYREGGSGRTPRIASEAARVAYLVARVRAIFQVNRLLDAELQDLCPAIDIRSVLDLGCGPGTATLAAQQSFGRLQTATLVDREPRWLEMAERLIAAADARLAAASHYMAVDLRDGANLGEHDLVVFSYALGELPEPAAKALVERAWASARRAIVIVEPGTPRGFGAILAARDALLAARANIVAPCTHGRRCPLAGADWCHFDTRVERTRRQRHVKAGTLPYEIEKFSYLIAAHEPPAMPARAARIIRRPLKKSGHVILDLCTCQGTAQRLIISRRDKDSYRDARAAKWGGPLDTGQQRSNVSAAVTCYRHFRVVCVAAR